MESVTSFSGWGVSFINPLLKSAWSFVGWGVCLTRPMMESVCSSGGCWSHLQAPCWSLSGRSPVETSLLHVGVEETPTHPLLESVSSVGSFSDTPRAGICKVVRRVGRLSSMPRTAICLVVCQVESFSYSPVLESTSYSPPPPVLVSV